MPSAYSRFRVLGSVAALAAAVTVGTGAATTLFGRPAAARSETNVPAVRYGTLSAKAARTMAEREISQAQLRDYLTFIASDELEGRDTPSRGLDIAARYIASHLSRWGLKPAGGDGTYFQKIALVRRGFDPAKSTATLGGKPLRYGEDFHLTGSGKAASGEGSLVFVGHGWVVKSKNIDAYQGADVKGKFLVVVANGPGRFAGPPGLRRTDLPEAGRGGDWLSPEEYAAKNGALGVVRIPASEDEEAFRRAALFLGRRAFVPEGMAGAQPAASAAAQQPALPSVQVSPAVARALLDGEKLSLADAQKAAQSAQGTPFSLAEGKRFKVSPVYLEEKATTQNVVAVLEGSDPKLKDEYVALGAHYDHVGVSPRGGEDVIFNGADDDGSGTVALMAVAEALARNPKERPRRSVLFVWHCGEEKGLWGSEYFTQKPTVPLDRIVTQVNMDMIGRSRKSGDADPRNANLSEPHQIYVIGAKKLSTQLGALAEKVNKSFLNIAYDYRYDDPDDPNRFYYRSDHYNYAKNGIPIIFFFDGVHEDYHQVGDEVEKIDFDKLAKVTQTVLLTTVEVANLPQRPVVDGKN